MRYLFLLAFLVVSLVSTAQVERVEIGINGLTCSQCSRSVGKKIEKLDFVKSVAIDLDKTIATVTFKNDNKIAVGKLAQAVRDAGFSVRNFYIITTLPPLANDKYYLGKDNITIINLADWKDTEKVKIELLGRSFSERIDRSYEQIKGLNNSNNYFGRLVTL